MPLTGKTILITGAAKRVGAAIAQRCHGMGANVIIHCNRSREAADALASALNHQRTQSAAVIQLNLLETDRLGELISFAISTFGQLDGLVNNASTFYPTPVGQITGQHFGDLMGSNVKAPLFLSQAAAPHLKVTGGSIVNIVDIHADRPMKGYPVYTAAKAALAGVTRAMAIELAPDVRVNGVSPGPIEWPPDQIDAAERERILSVTPLKKEGGVDEIAKAVTYLLSDAGYVTGQIIAVDGGRSVYL
jgi:pteridine reductase